MATANVVILTIGAEPPVTVPAGDETLIGTVVTDYLDANPSAPLVQMEIKRCVHRT